MEDLKVRETDTVQCMKSELSQQIEELKEDTIVLEEEYEHSKKKANEFEKSYQSLEIQIRKLQRDQELEIQKRTNYQRGVKDMIPIIDRDIRDTKEKIKKLRKEHREEINSLQSQLRSITYDLRKKEEELKVMEMLHRVELRMAAKHGITMGDDH